jgi:CDP-glucose 4,6-dehydratase
MNARAPGSSAASPFVPDETFWSGKRVLLTGHTGFKGSWLTLWLHRLGAQVRGYALPPDASPSMFAGLSIDRLCDDVAGDLRSRADLARAVTDFRPEVVFHLAAQSLVRPSYREPADTFEVNVQGTVNLLDACRSAPELRAVVVITSDKCYENRDWEWAYRESDRLGGHDPYSASKACAELVVASYRGSFFDGRRSAGVGQRRAPVLASARAGNVIGGGDWCVDRLIPDAARAFLRGDEVVVRNPHAVRPWQHVLEPLAGYLMLARACHQEGSAFAQGWNFGPPGDTLYPVAEVIETFAAAWGDGRRWRHQSEADAPHEARLLLLDAGLAGRRLAWRPQLALSEALALTAAWYRAHGAGLDAAGLRQLTFQQIADYRARLAAGGDLG